MVGNNEGSMVRAARETHILMICIIICIISAFVCLFIRRYLVLSFQTCVAEERDSPFSSPMGRRKHPTACLSLNHSQDIISASMISGVLPNLVRSCVGCHWILSLLQLHVELVQSHGSVSVELTERNRQGGFYRIKCKRMAVATEFLLWKYRMLRWDARVFQFPLWMTDHTLKWEGVWRELGCLARSASFAVREESGHTLKSALSVSCAWVTFNPRHPHQCS